MRRNPEVIALALLTGAMVFFEHAPSRVEAFSGRVVGANAVSKMERLHRPLMKIRSMPFTRMNSLQFTKIKTKPLTKLQAEPCLFTWR